MASAHIPNPSKTYLPKSGILASLAAPGEGRARPRGQVLVVRPGTAPRDVPADCRGIAVYPEVVDLPGGPGVRFVPLAPAPPEGGEWFCGGARLTSNAMLRLEVQRLVGGDFCLDHALCDLRRPAGR